MGVRLNQGWRLKVLSGSLASQTPASLASETTSDDSACVPMIVRVVEFTAFRRGRGDVMAVRRKTRLH